jgi:hypothetical protein
MSPVFDIIPIPNKKKLSARLIVIKWLGTITMCDPERGKRGRKNMFLMICRAWKFSVCCLFCCQLGLIPEWVNPTAEGGGLEFRMFGCLGVFACGLVYVLFRTFLN